MTVSGSCTILLTNKAVSFPFQSYRRPTIINGYCINLAFSGVIPDIIGEI